MLPYATQRSDSLWIVYDDQSDTLTIPRCGRLEGTLHDIGQEIRVDLLGAILAYAVASLCQLIEVRHIRYVSKRPSPPILLAKSRQSRSITHSDSYLASLISGCSKSMKQSPASAVPYRFSMVMPSVTKLSSPRKYCE